MHNMVARYDRTIVIWKGVIKTVNLVSTTELKTYIPFTVANLRFQLTELLTLNYLLYSPTDAAPQFL